MGGPPTMSISFLFPEEGLLFGVDRAWASFLPSVSQRDSLHDRLRLSIEQSGRHLQDILKLLLLSALSVTLLRS